MSVCHIQANTQALHQATLKLSRGPLEVPPASVIHHISLAQSGRCKAQFVQQVSLRAAGRHSGEETGPGLGIRCSLPILPMQTDTQHGGLE